jgi:hypothetical protein
LFELTAENLEKVRLNQERIRIISYAMLDGTEHKLEEVIKGILEFYEHGSLLEAVYTATKELAINAVKANMKRIVFQENNLQLNVPDENIKGMELFKERLSAGNLEEFCQKSHQLGYLVYIDFLLFSDVFYVEICNNSIITKNENVRLREKLSRSMTYEDIAQFYMDFADDTEGAGLGMTMITVMLKQENIDPHCFTIFDNGKYTIARLEIPVVPDYVPRRKRYKT